MRETGFGDRIVIEIDDPVKIVDVMKFLKVVFAFGMKVGKVRDPGLRTAVSYGKGVLNDFRAKISKVPRCFWLDLPVGIESDCGKSQYE